VESSLLTLHDNLSLFLSQIGGIVNRVLSVPSGGSLACTNQPLGSAGAGNAAISPGFFQCCDCTFAFQFKPPIGTVGPCTSGQLGILFAGDSGVGLPQNNTINFYLDTFLFSGATATFTVDICQLTSCQTVATSPYSSGLSYLLVGKVDHFSLSEYTLCFDV